jgi:hypothetical protein
VAVLVSVCAASGQLASKGIATVMANERLANRWVWLGRHRGIKNLLNNRILHMSNGPVVLLVGSFMQLYGTNACLSAAQLKQHLVGGVVAVFWPAPTKVADGIGIDRSLVWRGLCRMSTATTGRRLPVPQRK